MSFTSVLCIHDYLLVRDDRGSIGLLASSPDITTDMTSSFMCNIVQVEAKFLTFGKGHNILEFTEMLFTSGECHRFIMARDHNI